MKTLHNPLHYRSATSTHEPMGTDEFVGPQYIALSDVPYNQLRSYSDGLYVGNRLPLEVYYIAASGVDAPDRGTKALPFKTLNYCLTTLLSLSPSNIYNSDVIIALKAGETFSMPNSMYMYGGTLTLTFWGDAQYGDFNSPAINGASPWVMADLNRPIIAAALQPSTVGGTTGFILVGDPFYRNVGLVFQGVQVNLFNGAHSTGAVDFVSIVSSCRGTVTLKGAIVNITDTSSVFGFMGMEPSTKGRLYQYASQFRVLNTLVAAGAPADQLLCRKWFIKFYPDFNGNHQDGLDLFGGAPGSALLELSWSDVASVLVVPGKSNLGTYPVLNDAATGLANYFYNLTRDQQSRPLNCLTSRLF